MKQEVAEYVAKCLACQRVIMEYQKPTGLLQSVEVPELKWVLLFMDFVMDL